MSEEFLYPEFETKWSNSEIIDMLFDWAKFCMKNKTGDLSNDTAEYFSDKLKAKIAVCSPDTPPTTEADLWKEKIQDIIRKHIRTCILDGGEMKTPDDKIGLMGEYNAATEILELLSRRSEQNTPGDGRGAIEFKLWCDENESRLCFQEQRTLTTGELYSAFKQKQ